MNKKPHHQQQKTKQKADNMYIYDSVYHMCIWNREALASPTNWSVLIKDVNYYIYY